MTQPFTSDDRLSNALLLSGQGKGAEDSVGQLSNLPDTEQPAIVHPNFDPNQTPIDPARPLQDIPEPARRTNSQLRRLYGKSVHFSQPNEHSLSKWRLIGSEALAEHLALLSAAKLMTLPDSFYHNYSDQPLSSSLESLTLLDMADIQRAIGHYPTLNRYGFVVSESKVNARAHKLQKTIYSHDPDELLSSIYADDWQVVLQPQQFETGEGSLATDIMACSVAVHVLKQCQTRKSINHSYSAAQICEYVRSYLLSQLSIAPMHRNQYRQIRLFAGHIIVAAYHLGWSIQVGADEECHFNLSSRCGLLTRYANMPDYHINGWSS
ncbi:hypothetical protein H4W00_000925 [Psychrobacter sp. PL19]|uniref:hypothetical protein n=1 Tax=Psychrobacter sp. PL19 TaxID=2760711 RepID=UPI001AE88582